MANELYQTQIVTKLGQAHSTATFYWILNNLTLEHPYRVAQDINKDLLNDTPWLLLYLDMLNVHCVVSSLKTRRFDPLGGATADGIFPFDEPAGTFAGRWDFDFVSATIQWHTANDRRGRYQSRIGFLSAGTMQPGAWYPLFAFRALTWATQHRQARTTTGGHDFQAACRASDGTAAVIDSETLRWPPSRQKNRRAKV